MNERHGTADPGPTTGEGGAGLVALAGLAAYTELAAFGLLASRSVDAPDLGTRQALATAAGRALHRQRGLLDLAAVHGVEPASVMAPFDGVLADFDARTTPGNWHEGLLKGVVGHGVAEDFCRLLAAGLAQDQVDALRSAVALDAEVPDASEVLTAAAAADAVLASRLGLWGRRVVGEALGLVPTLLTAHPELSALAARARAAVERDGGALPGDDGGLQSWFMARLTAEHTRRMDRMHLAA
ncbi:ferritin-like domain-containing protein [Isoptericola sp. NEAU-Y5]|uniref:Ferritin-like domain-containing protein n=1 Tax=Isoptericola luteus TaxID=2879484 RepID=A0ABS7ZDE7_9MICO|nr:ferritin-like fold-containing protein [Isoptericola sp. NEAU-Y5]MCA5892482.1 ferritin-like domain-containing protein [Isoptericola sp. NEAU-Y5]